MGEDQDSGVALLSLGLTDDVIQEFAKGIQDGDFFDIGFRLGFTKAELVELDTEYKHDTHRASIEMLSRWRTKNASPEGESSVSKATLQGIIETSNGIKTPGVEVKDGKNGLPHETVTIVDAKPKGDDEDGDVGYDFDNDFGQAASWSKVRIYKNLLLMGTAFVFLFAAYQALSNLQSSINCIEGLGLVCLSATYATVILSAMFVPAIVIRHLGMKWTLALSMCGYALFIAANYYPSWGTLLPASIMVGLSCAPLWTSKSTYLTTVARAYANISGEKVRTVVTRFWGIFFVFAQLSQVIGNLISSLVLQPETSGNHTAGIRCGSQDCHIETGGDDEDSYCNPPDKDLTYTLLTIYLASSIVAVLFVVFAVDNLSASRKMKNRGTCDLFSSTFRLMGDYRLRFMVPFAIYSGMHQAFITGDYTKSYVTCTMGVGLVGNVMICYGAGGAVSSFTCGRVAKYTGQIPLFMFGALLDACLMTTLFLWEPQSSDFAVFFVIPALWGVSVAIWQTQLNALFGLLFHDEQEPAFSNFRLWQSVGFTVAFAYSNFVCVWVKLIVLGCILVVAMTGYAMVEFTTRRSKKAHDYGQVR